MSRVDAGREVIIGRLGGIVDDRPNQGEVWSILRLSSAISALATAEGREWVHDQVCRIMRGEYMDGADRPMDERWADAKEYVAQTLIDGRSDTYSGRGNDLERSYMDGVKEEARYVLVYDERERYL